MIKQSVDFETDVIREVEKWEDSFKRGWGG